MHNVLDNYMVVVKILLLRYFIIKICLEYQINIMIASVLL